MLAHGWSHSVIGLTLPPIDAKPLYFFHQVRRLVWWVEEEKWFEISIFLGIQREWFTAVLNAYTPVHTCTSDCRSVLSLMFSPFTGRTISLNFAQSYPSQLQGPSSLAPLILEDAYRIPDQSSAPEYSRTMSLDAGTRLTRPSRVLALVPVRRSIGPVSMDGLVARAVLADSCVLAARGQGCGSLKAAEWR